MRLYQLINLKILILNLFFFQGLIDDELKLNPNNTLSFLLQGDHPVKTQIL
ncbi:unknown protein [Microcystis aeruginosa NIES-843]|uniref:Transposase n=1 Tax=Microcystis aeruginosa (strain NIES-843 / IAM M-2473) TaxID=449447 RepID=B0JQ42_MICAN|nr:unknown protein [Microcystis aeruginosa NIES-843]